MKLIQKIIQMFFIWKQIWRTFNLAKKCMNLNILKETKFSKYTKVSDFPSVTRDIFYS